MKTLLTSSAVAMFGVIALALPQPSQSRAADNHSEEMTIAPFATMIDNVEHVFVRTRNGDVEEYYYAGDKGWFRNDLTTLANAPKAAGNPMSYFVAGEKVGHVVYRGTDNQIHELYHGRDNDKWFTNNLCTTANAPKAAGDPCGYAVPDNNTQHVFYRGEDGSVNELFYTQEGGAKGWQAHNLTAEANAPKAAGNPHAFLLPASWMRFSKDRDRQHVLYRDTNGHVMELFFSTKDKKWVVGDLSKDTNAPMAAGDPCGYFLESTNTQHVVFRNNDGNVCELFYSIDARDAKWHLKDLTQEANAPKAVSDPFAYVRNDDKSEYVVYRSADGQVQELFFSPRQAKWAHNNLSADTRAPKAIGRPAANLTPTPITQHVFFVSNDHKVMELFRGGEGADQKWHLMNLTDNVEKR
jgi:hypothetical protein